jgi:ComF family protein
MGGIKFIHSPTCPACGRPFAAEGQPEHLCHACLNAPYHFAKARAVTFYDGSVLEAVHRFKFGKKIIYARTLAGLRTGDGLFNLDHFDLFVPVPLHVKRLRQRGFNQTLLLLREWAGEEKKDKIDFTTLVRYRWTEPQTNLKHHERRKNIKGAFAVKRPDKVRGKNILLCDDVFTTGATVNECARVLKEAGAREVSVLTLARATAQ